jgi:Icc-related predicted phosphoesterase
MKLLFVADLHYTLKQFDWLLAEAPKFDAVSIGGDLLDLSSQLDFDVQIAVVEKYLHKLREKTLMLVSSGNHDGDSRNEADESVALWLSEAKAERLVVDNESVLVGEVLITVCPWWDGPLSRGQLEEFLARESAKPRRRWIWVHHAPSVRSPTSWTGKSDGGDEYLRAWIERFQPDLVLSGHIHGSPFYEKGSWVDQIGVTWVFNPGQQIGPYPTHIRLDLDGETAEWISLEDRSIKSLAFADR